MKRLSLRDWGMILALLVALGAWYFQHIQRHAFEEAERETAGIIMEIQATHSLKKTWGTQGLRTKLKRLKKSLPAAKIKRFEIKRSTVEIALENLQGRLLNRFLGKLGRLPLQVQTLAILRDGERYRLECRCHW